MPRVRISKSSGTDLEKSLREGMPYTFAMLADLCRSEGRYDDAEAICLKGMEEFTDYDSGHMVLGRVFLDKGEPQKALIEFHLALKCDPENTLALKSIADVHWEAGEYLLARSYYRQVLQRDRYCPEALERIKGKPRSQPVEPAGELETVEERPETLSPEEKDVFNTVTLAKLYARQGHSSLARQVCRGILEKDPENERVKAVLQELESRTGNN